MSDTPTSGRVPDGTEPEGSPKQAPELAFSRTDPTTGEVRGTRAPGFGGPRASANARAAAPRREGRLCVACLEALGEFAPSLEFVVLAVEHLEVLPPRDTRTSPDRRQHMQGELTPISCSASARSPGTATTTPWPDVPGGSGPSGGGVMGPGTHSASVILRDQKRGEFVGASDLAARCGRRSTRPSRRPRRVELVRERLIDRRRDRR